MHRITPHDELPLDPDAEITGVTRPLHFQLGHVLAVVFGGMAGTAARYGLTTVWTTPATGFPFAVFAINVTGALVLGVLLEALARRGEDGGRRRSIRLLAGTGFCGGFTTYSTLAMQAVLLVRATHSATAAAYGIASVLAGLLGAWGGIAIASIEHRRRTRVAAVESR